MRMEFWHPCGLISVCGSCHEAYLFLDSLNVHATVGCLTAAQLAWILSWQRIYGRHVGARGCATCAAAEAHMTLVLFSTPPLIAHLKVNMKPHELKLSSDTPVPFSRFRLCGSHIAI